MKEFIVINLVIWFVAALLYAILTWISVGVYSGRALRQLRRADPDKWAYLTSSEGKSGGQNAFRSFSYLYEENDSEPAEIVEYKRKCRKGVRSAVLASGIAGCLILVLAGIALSSK